MHNISIHFESEVENLYYATIEKEIDYYFNMGSIFYQYI